MNFKIEKATKEKAYLRMAIFGISGSGKTYSSLAIASGLGKKTIVIDTERNSASKYADRFSFDVINLNDPSIDHYIDCIRLAGETGYDTLIIDSLSHGWQQLLEQVDKIASAKYRGNKWSAWSEGTPLQRKLIQAILSFSGHVLATMRVKTEWTTEKDERTGKNRPIRLGLSPEQGKGIEYEFDMLLDLNPEHTAMVIKDRTGKFQDEIINKPGKEMGKTLKAWLADGVTPKEPIPMEEPATPRETITIKDVDSCNDVQKLREMHSQAKDGKIKKFIFEKGTYLAKAVDCKETGPKLNNFTLDFKDQVVKRETLKECPPVIAPSEIVGSGVSNG